MTRLDLGDVYGLGFREQCVQVISSTNKQGHKVIFLPRFGPSEGNTVRPACLYCFRWGDYNWRDRSCSRSKGNRELWLWVLGLSLDGGLSWPYIGGQVPRSNPCRSTIEWEDRLPYAKLSLRATYHNLICLHINLQYRQ